MKKILAYAALLLFCNSYGLANDLDFEARMHFQPTPEYIVLENLHIGLFENQSGLPAQCSLMQGSYLSLWQAYKAESAQLMSLLDQSRNTAPDAKADLLPQMQEVHAKLKKIIDELNRLARPEWNRELLQVLVSWSLPQSALFSVTETDPDIRDSLVDRPMAAFLAAKGLPVRQGLPPSALNGLKNRKKKTYFAGLDYRVTAARYMGEDSAALLPFFSVQSILFQNLMEKDIHFDYYKPMTWLEYCQLTETAEFSIEVTFALKNFGGGYAEKNQKFILRSLQNEK